VQTGDQTGDSHFLAVIEGVPEQVDPKVLRAAWARLIKQVYEADPLVCPRCGGEMRFLSLI